MNFNFTSLSTKNRNGDANDEKIEDGDGEVDATKILPFMTL